MNDQIDAFTRRLSVRVYRYLERRVERAYPAVQPVPEKKRNRNRRICRRMQLLQNRSSLHHRRILGDITETIFCRITAGVWMSRSSLVWGPFSIVWGLAIALATWFLYNYRDRSDGFLFAFGTFLGGAYEYICSVFTESYSESLLGLQRHSLQPRRPYQPPVLFLLGNSRRRLAQKFYPVISRWIEKSR